MVAAVPPLREKVVGISPEVEQIVLTALAKDPKQRFGSVQAFATALEQAASLRPGLAPTLYQHANPGQQEQPPQDAASVQAVQTPPIATPPPVSTAPPVREPARLAPQSDRPAYAAARPIQTPFYGISFIYMCLVTVLPSCFSLYF